MKSLILATLIILFSPLASAIDKPIFLGKIVKTDRAVNGNNYFVTYNKDGKVLAYPIKNPSDKVKNLKGKLVRIWGKTEFKKAPYKESQYIMYFDIEKTDVLKLSDLGVNEKIFDDQQLEKFAKAPSSEDTSGEYREGFRVSDKVANTAIFVGGAMLAAEVLRAMAAGPN